jgi:hypothetical protein
MLGISNLKTLVKFSCDFTKQIATALSDGKFQWLEALGFIDEIMQIPGVVKTWPEIKLEVADLTAEERQELHAYVVTEFDIPNDRVEGFIEYALMNAVSIVAMVEGWKAILKK